MPISISPGQQQRLGKKTFWLFVLNHSGPTSGLIVIAILLFVLRDIATTAVIGHAGTGASLAALLGLIGLVTIALAALSAGIALLVAWLIYKNYTFSLEEDSLRVARGVFGKEEITIPYRQIQDVDIERPLFFRLFGVSRLVILTAGREAHEKTDESEGVLPALDKDLAEYLRGVLTKRADVEEVQEEPPQAPAAPVRNATSHTS